MFLSVGRVPRRGLLVIGRIGDMRVMNRSPGPDVLSAGPERATKCGQMLII